MGNGSGGKGGPGLEDVLVDLVSEGVERIKSLFQTQVVMRCDLERLAIEIVVEVEQVYFEAQSGYGLRQGGPQAHVKDGRVGFAGDTRASSVHTVGGATAVR
jgi:hypothetical protein